MGMRSKRYCKWRKSCNMLHDLSRSAAATLSGSLGAEYAPLPYANRASVYALIQWKFTAHIYAYCREELVWSLPKAICR